MCVCLKIIVVLISIVAVIVYRIAIAIPLQRRTSGVVRDQSATVAAMTAAVLNLILIMILGTIYQKLALLLTRWGERVQRLRIHGQPKTLLRSTAFDEAGSLGDRKRHPRRRKYCSCISLERFLCAARLRPRPHVEYILTKSSPTQLWKPHRPFPFSFTTKISGYESICNMIVPEPLALSDTR